MAKLYKPQLIISVKEMRKLLGKDCGNMSDKQIELLILTLTESSSMLLNQKGSKKSSGKLQYSYE